MHHHAGGLVDDHQRVVFVAHVKRQLLGHDGGVEVWPLQPQTDDVARAYLIITFNRSVVDKEIPALSRLLYAVAAGVLRVLGEVFVDAQWHLPTVHLYPQVLIQLLAFCVVGRAFAGFQLVVVQEFVEKSLFLVHLLSMGYMTIIRRRCCRGLRAGNRRCRRHRGRRRSSPLHRRNIRLRRPRRRLRCQ